MTTSCCQYIQYTHVCITQEFRTELQAAEAKDKKFLKRKTVLKKIVANITMGNDSEKHLFSFLQAVALKCLRTAVSPLFTDVVQCLGTPLLEIKKSRLCC
jgi:AP-2 complex subunit beta-1